MSDIKSVISYSPFLLSYHVCAALFYYTLGNLEPSLRSSMQSIQLLSVVRSPLVNKYGIDTILTPFMTDLKELEKVQCASLTLVFKLLLLQL